MSIPVESEKKENNKSNKKFYAFFAGGLALGVLITSGVFLSQIKKNALDISTVIGTPFFKVDGKVYTTSDLPGDSSMKYYKLESNIFNAKQNFAYQTALRIALAKDAQKPINSSLPSLEELMPVQSVSDTEAKEYYDKIVAQMGEKVFKGQTFEQLKDELKTQLNQQKAGEAFSKKIQELSDSGRLQFLLQQPKSPTVSLNTEGYPSRGNPNASITLVEVADYLCAHCREAEPAIESLYKKYGEKIKFIQVMFPLAPQGLSGALAKGAFCANQQGGEQFWKYHTQAFQVAWDKAQPPEGQNAPAYFNNVAIDIAKNTGLDVEKFSTCLISNNAEDYIKNVRVAFDESKGFEGTPTFYLNNQLIRASPEQLESTVSSAIAKLN